MSLIFVDTDLALGSRKGNLDDAFALSWLLACRVPMQAITTVSGHTSASLALENAKRLTEYFLFDQACIRGKDPDSKTPNVAAHVLSQQTGASVLALGPLTNLAEALVRNPFSISHFTSVAGTHSFFSRQANFNFAFDKDASTAVFSKVPQVTLIPQDVANRMVVSRDELRALPGAVGTYLLKRCDEILSDKWRWKKSNHLVLGDLLVAAYHIQPQLLKRRTQSVTLDAQGRVLWDQPNKEIEVVYDFERDLVWKAFLADLKKFQPDA